METKTVLLATVILIGTLGLMTLFPNVSLGAG